MLPAVCLCPLPCCVWPEAWTGCCRSFLTPHCWCKFKVSGHSTHAPQLYGKLVYSDYSMCVLVTTHMYVCTCVHAHLCPLDREFLNGVAVRWVMDGG